MIAHAVAGFGLALAIALLAWRARAISTGAATLAIALGTTCVIAGWDWGVLLIAFFLSSSILSRFRRDVRERRTAGIVDKTGARDARQVAANGIIASGSALLSVFVPWDGWMAIGGGALAAATADTWSTEIGTLFGEAPRLLITWQVVPTGTSGGVSAMGTLALVGGASFLAAMASLIGWKSSLTGALLAGGIVGALADSAMGARWQGRRWCSACETGTERLMHVCGNATKPAGGIAWLDNDWVNFLSTITGALVALVVYLLS